ncbi:hypothetical protein psal_cds_157 [Pandoravirus salinus]|uniref:Uncharacterized protein n=1 Tax=Pandoravirus salinus TaxID=1349410 RepID=S4VT52_9VIRU|nr:hypothetical protein psal_cds_157 [Pandoravirus salinus]AGO83634.2 hypothetical protein psal_cds_157 [Pandoravirus salinus]
MHETDVGVPRHQQPYERVILDVSVPRLYISAVRVCARRNPERHALWLERLGSAERALPAHRFDDAATAAVDALHRHVRAYVANNEDVAAEASSLMDRLAAMLTARGAQIIGRDPTTVRCTRWWQQRQDWMDAATTLGRSTRPRTVAGLLFGRDYAATVHLVQAHGRDSVQARADGPALSRRPFFFE